MTTTTWSARAKRRELRDRAPRPRAWSIRARARQAGDKFGCPHCHKEHKTRNGNVSCDAHRRKTRPPEPCLRDPIEGGFVCTNHGGKIPAVTAAAVRRLAYAEGEGEVAAMLRQLDMPDMHPIEGLLEVVRHTGGMFRLIGQLCAQLNLEPGEIGIAINEKTGEVTKWTKDTALYGYDHTGDQAPHVLLLLYKNWAEMYAKACKLALDANIDERLVRNAEHTSNAMFTAVQKAMTESDMDAETAVRFSKALAGQLRQLMDPFSTLEGGNAKAKGRRPAGQGSDGSSADGQAQAKAITRRGGDGQGNATKKRKRARRG